MLRWLAIAMVATGLIPLIDGQPGVSVFFLTFAGLLQVLSMVFELRGRISVLEARTQTDKQEPA